MDKKSNSRSKTAFRLITAAALIGLFAFVGAKKTEAVSIMDSTVGPGDSGINVTHLQQFLGADPDIYPENNISGFYGSLTESAVQRFQCYESIVCSGSPSTNGYGQVGPATLAKINEVAEIKNGLPVLDIRAPVMSPDNVLTASSSATVSWRTLTEPAYNRVMYNTTSPFLFASAPSASNPEFTTTASVILTGLTPNTTYYYWRESYDQAGNIMYAGPSSFTTSVN